MTRFRVSHPKYGLTLLANLTYDQMYVYDHNTARLQANDALFDDHYFEAR